MNAPRSPRGATAAVLAGGLGTRLRAVVPGRQKALAPVGGRPFVAHVLDWLADAGLAQVVLCTGYLGEQVRETLGDAYRGLRLVHSREPEPLGTGGALRFALPHLDGDPVLVVNGDSLCRASLAALWARHLACAACGTLVVTPVPDVGRYGRVEVGKNDRVLRFEEKAAIGGGGWVSAGVYLLSRDLVASIPGGKPVSLEREVFPAWVGRGLHAHPVAESFVDIGTPDAYAAAGTALAHEP
ncbi:MAG: nucleotidyltransferase family protein [Candidatus Binatia bacterium]